MVIDSRSGEDFAAFTPGSADGSGPAIGPRFDACASWWTQVSSMPMVLVNGLPIRQASANDNSICIAAGILLHDSNPRRC